MYAEWMVWFSVTFSIKGGGGGTAEMAHRVMTFIVQAWQSEFDPQNISRGGGENRFYKGVLPSTGVLQRAHPHTDSIMSKYKQEHTH